MKMANRTWSSLDPADPRTFVLIPLLQIICINQNIQNPIIPGFLEIPSICHLEAHIEVLPPLAVGYGEGQHSLLETI